MNDEALLGLALASLTDDDAMLVLRDWALELTAEDTIVLGKRVLTHFSEWEIIASARTNAAAIAAVLLFESWPTSWPLAERCRRPRRFWGETRIIRAPRPMGLLAQLVNEGSQRQGNGA